ncbi:hypothetical protein BC629DRAFT_162202 [Irpex lacteus]|nr:hypothetical protein BC629DRAFT_162202 [Irpex lacteus]
MDKSSIPPPSFKFDIAQMESAFSYLTRGFEWLSTRSNHEFDSLSASPKLNSWLQLESAAVENLVSAIRGSQNRIAGINRLPEEILGYIFEVLADLVRDDTEMRLRSSWRNLPQERWLQINLVCRHWRRIALSRPALWTCIYFGAPNKDPSGNDLTAMSLGRSGILPLTLPRIAHLRSMEVHSRRPRLPPIGMGGEDSDTRGSNSGK